jgi:hypothetical protein
MYVTRHSPVTDAGMLDRLWQLYDAAYTPVSFEVPSHEMLFRDEFEELVADQTNRLWVLWDDSSPIAMSLIATDIAPSRYLSRSFFEHRYPEQSRRQAVHYVMWLVVHPAAATTTAVARLAREVLQREAADGALLVFDVPQVHQKGLTGGFAEIMARMAKSFVGPAPVVHLGTQYYFAVDFADTAPRDGSDADDAQALDVPSAAGPP